MCPAFNKKLWAVQASILISGTQGTIHRLWYVKYNWYFLVENWRTLGKIRLQSQLFKFFRDQRENNSLHFFILENVYPSNFPGFFLCLSTWSWITGLWDLCPLSPHPAGSVSNSFIDILHVLLFLYYPSVICVFCCCWCLRSSWVISLVSQAVSS